MNQSLPIAESDLPEIAIDLIRIVGWDGALCLIQKLAGQRWPVPMGSDNNPAGRARFDALATCVGSAGAAAIVAEYGGTWLDIPTCKTAVARARARQLRARRSNGARIEQLVSEFGLSRRRVFEILATEDSAKDSRQLDMFGNQ